MLEEDNWTYWSISLRVFRWALVVNWIAVNATKATIHKKELIEPGHRDVCVTLIYVDGDKISLLRSALR